jgi:hypothetical protein
MAQLAADEDPTRNAGSPARACSALVREPFSRSAEEGAPASVSAPTGNNSGVRQASSRRRQRGLKRLAASLT